MTAHIFIESDKETSNEGHFITQYIHHIHPSADIKVECVGGKEKLVKLKPKLDVIAEDGEISLVIFDSDFPKTGGGFDNRKSSIENLRNTLDLKITDFFLFPNNNDDGAFENMLLKIVNQRHRGLLNCFTEYELCIAGNDPKREHYDLPNVKAEIYSYISSFKRSNRERESFKRGNWDFENIEYWNLDDTYLDPLKEFLLKYLN